MIVTFKNPQGKVNSATLNDEQVEKLTKLEGYNILNIEVCESETQSEEQQHGVM